MNAPTLRERAPLFGFHRTFPIVLFLLSFAAFAGRPGLSLQVYPAGVIAGVQVIQPDFLLDESGLRLAMNLTDRRDWGEHDNEDGGGGGVGVFTREAISEEFLVGARLDLWSLGISWEEDDRRGTSDILVLQPTAEVIYRPSRLPKFSFTAGLGAEINIDTDGEDVGEGFIGLLGVEYQF